MNRAPSSVSLMRLPIRSNSWVPSSRSSCFICTVTAAWEYPSCSAALEKLPSSATRKKVAAILISIGTALYKKK